HSVSGQFAIRQGDWKLVEGSGDGDYPRNKKGKIDVQTWNPKRDPKSGKWAAFDYFQLQPDGKHQLYHLGSDPKETNDVSKIHPEKIHKLQKLLETYRDSGRSVPAL
ncbi:MAG: hypothetical protein KJO79_07345, partial [Verrucomicrobiae bacterium]|nr:hypothetical protein [Verrucomicrobiae bacterium]NNJ86975.1 hypothetical protein [Akkermansiaceae bacterium]